MTEPPRGIQPVNAGATGSGDGVGAGGGVDSVNDSTKVSEGPADRLKPTAMHDDALTQDTECRTLSCEPGLGLATTDHTMPSHDSTNDS